MKLRIGIPKGSLQESTLRLFRNAGYTIKLAERSYVPVIDDPELEGLVIRAQEMGRYVENGILDMGITGLDWVLEQNSKVREVARLRYSKVGFKGVKWVVAVPNDSPIKDIKGLKGKIIATELVGFTTRFLKSQKIDATVEYSWGATEAKPPRLADAIVEVTETGASLVRTTFASSIPSSNRRRLSSQTRRPSGTSGRRRRSRTSSCFSRPLFWRTGRWASR